MDAILHEGIEQGAGAEDGERLVDAAGSLLVGELDDVGGSVVELAIVAGGCVFRSPGGGVDPDELCTPPMIAHDDESG